MFTLIIFALGMAAIAASFLSTTPGPLKFEEALPAACMGLAWRRVGERNTRNGKRTLWAAQGDTSWFQRAYAADREATRTAGFSSDDRTPVCWEGIPTASDEEVLAVVAAAESKADAVR